MGGLPAQQLWLQFHWSFHWPKINHPGRPGAAAEQESLFWAKFQLPVVLFAWFFLGKMKAG